jgi:hypothetical protein
MNGDGHFTTRARSGNTWCSVTLALEETRLKTMTKAGGGDGPDFRYLSIMCKNKDALESKPQTYDNKIAKRI